jgi:hypothetical protein
MVFATDYPQNFNSSDPKSGKSVDGIRDYIEEIQNLPLEQRVKSDMLGGTAARLLKLHETTNGSSETMKGERACCASKG